MVTKIVYRSAIVRDRPEDELERVRAYMPSNYGAYWSFAENAIVISGHDNAGWTLDGYVIPRLASGMIIAHEITDKREVT